MFQIAKGLFKAGWILLTMPILLWRLSIASLAVVEFSIDVMATTPELLEQTQLKEGKSPEAAKATARYGRIIAKGILWFTFLLPYIWFLATSAATVVLIVAGISLIAIGSIFATIMATIMIVAATIAAWPTFVPWLVDNVHIDIPLISGVANAQTATRIVAVAIVSLIAWSIYRTQNKRVKKLETLWKINSAEQTSPQSAKLRHPNGKSTSNASWNRGRGKAFRLRTNDDVTKSADKKAEPHQKRNQFTKTA